MNFGDRDKMVALANGRLAAIKPRFPKASVSGFDELRVFYLLVDDPDAYYIYARADTISGDMDRKTALRKMGKSRPL